MYYGCFPSWGLTSMLIMALFWGGIILAIALAIRHLAPPGTKQHAKAIDILRERYAKGDITKEEFETKKKDIEA